LDPVLTPVADTVDPVLDSVLAPVDPIVDPVLAPVTDTVDPIVDPVLAPVTDPLAAPVTDPLAAPLAAPVADPLAAPVADPLAAPQSTEPVSASIAEPLSPTPFAQDVQQPLLEGASYSYSVAETQGTKNERSLGSYGTPNPLFPFGFPLGAPPTGTTFSSSSGIGLSLELLAILALLYALSRRDISSVSPREVFRLVSSPRLVTELPG
jgi:hypothetical protein